jgi:hypothetical protein
MGADTHPLAGGRGEAEPLLQLVQQPAVRGRGRAAAAAGRVLHVRLDDAAGEVLYEKSVTRMSHDANDFEWIAAYSGPAGARRRR